MPKRRITSRQRAASIRNLARARAARQREAKHRGRVASAKTSRGSIRALGRANKSNRKSAAFKLASMGILPQGKTGRKSRMGAGRTTELARRRPRKSTGPGTATLRRARGGRTLKRRSNAERAAGVKWGAELHGRIGSRGSVTRGTRTKKPGSTFRPEGFGKGGGKGTSTANPGRATLRRTKNMSWETGRVSNARRRIRI